jgi:hypothetical protein
LRFQKTPDVPADVLDDISELEETCRVNPFWF